MYLEVTSDYQTGSYHFLNYIFKLKLSAVQWTEDGVIGLTGLSATPKLPSEGDPDGANALLL